MSDPGTTSNNVLRDSQLVILCGGKGTRLREETEWKPKPMVLVGEWPILWHIMRYYACFGVRRFVLCLGYKGELIKDFFLSYHQQWADLKVHLGKNDITYVDNEYVGGDWEVILANTGLDTGTGGRVSAIKKYIDQDRFLLTYGDGLSNVDLNAAVDVHLKAKRIGTVTAVRPLSRFGELIIRGDNVDSFSEKPNVSAGWISGGFFVFEKEVFDYLPDDSPETSFEFDTLRKIADDQKLSVYKHEGFWQCVDTYRELVLVEKMWISNQAPWKRW